MGALLSTVRHGVTHTMRSFMALKRWIPVKVPPKIKDDIVAEMDIDITELLRLEAGLKTSREHEVSPVGLDAKGNILKYLQVHKVQQFQSGYDDLYYELNKTGGLDCLRSIAPVRSTELLQPKVLDLQDCGEDDQLEQQLQFYLADAELATPRLDELVTSVARDSSKYEVQRVEVKSRESTRRKASRFCGGDVRKVADMARVTVICATPEALKEAYVAITKLSKQDILRVKNGFNSDWMPSGYRDVKLNPVVNEHLCEIQLHLREFFALKDGQHAVYEWARELNVTTEMCAEDLFKSLSPEVTKEMIRLAGENWRGTGFWLPDLQVAAGQYDLAEKSHRQYLRFVEHQAREFEDQDNKISRRALLIVNLARARLAHVLEKQGKFEEAEPLYLRSLAICVKLYGPDHPQVATGLSNLAELLESQAKYDKAESLYERSQTIREKAVGPDHPDVAMSLNNRAGLLTAQGKFEEAEPLYIRSLAIDEKVYGPDHPKVAAGLHNWATLYENQGKYEEAEPLYVRSLAIHEKVHGPDHPIVATILNNWATLLTYQDKYEEAEPLYVRSLAIREKVFGADHPDVARVLNNWAELLRRKGKYGEAEPLYVRSLAMYEKVYGPDHPQVATSLNNWALVLESQGKYDEAKPLYERTQAIFEKSLGGNHPSIATILNNRASLVENQGKYEEAGSLYRRSLAIREQALGPDHPEVAQSLFNRAALFCKQGKYAEAGPLYTRSLAIREQALGPDHPDVALSLNNLAVLLSMQEKYTEAIPRYKKALSIRTKKLGGFHPLTVETRKDLEVVWFLCKSRCEAQIEEAACRGSRHCKGDEDDRDKATKGNLHQA